MGQLFAPLLLDPSTWKGEPQRLGSQTPSPLYPWWIDVSGFDSGSATRGLPSRLLLEDSVMPACVSCSLCLQALASLFCPVNSSFPGPAHSPFFRQPVLRRQGISFLPRPPHSSSHISLLLHIRMLGRRIQVDACLWLPIPTFEAQGGRPGGFRCPQPKGTRARGRAGSGSQEDNSVGVKMRPPACVRRGGQRAQRRPQSPYALQK